MFKLSWIQLCLKLLTWTNIFLFEFELVASFVCVAVIDIASVDIGRVLIVCGVATVRTLTSLLYFRVLLQCKMEGLKTQRKQR